MLAQEEEKAPKYYTVTTFHWNMDYEDFDMDTWKAMEKEYLDHVTMKNEHIMRSSLYLHHTTPDNTELLGVQVFDSWDAIEKASARNRELAKEAWPDEDKRKAYFKSRRAYYSNSHSDEIYRILPYTKPLAEKATKELILYLRKGHFAFPKDGDGDEIKKLRTEYMDNIIHKNEHIKAYYSAAHYYGADGTESVEAFLFDSMDELDKMFDRIVELRKEAWPDEDVRKARGKLAQKYFTQVHGDYIYSLVHELSK
ncbi:MAG: hypothetical protein COA50_15050 [Flavobacteriaceae bacterium]|nr:MAG: hypothetical protein COA50_15050 [Flavobacteriaceae bacterium]